MKGSIGTSDKSNNSKRRMIYCSCFSNLRFKFQDSECNVFHGLTFLNVKISDINNIIVENVDYRCVIYNI